MPLGHHLKIMSEAKSAPKGLKDQEVERESVKKHLPIPYIPVVDKVQDAFNKSKGKVSTYTIKLPVKLEFTVNIWDAGTPKAFLIHVQTAISACKRKGLFSNYHATTEDAQVASEAVILFHEVIAKAKAQAGKTKKGIKPDPPDNAEEPLLNWPSLGRNRKWHQKDSFLGLRLAPTFRGEAR